MLQLSSGLYVWHGKHSASVMAFATHQTNIFESYPLLMVYSCLHTSLLQVQGCLAHDAFSNLTRVTKLGCLLLCHTHLFKTVPAPSALHAFHKCPK
jgi:hypothetical protein